MIAAAEGREGSEICPRQENCISGCIQFPHTLRRHDGTGHTPPAPRRPPQQPAHPRQLCRRRPRGVDSPQAGKGRLSLPHLTRPRTPRRHRKCPSLGPRSHAQTPPHTAHVLDRARYLTNVPQPQDLTPPVGLFPLARSASIATILNHLLATPPPSIQHSREVILEYVLSREAKLKEKKPGRAGKGTLGREAFEDIAKRMGELEDSLRGNSASSPPTSPSRDAYPSPHRSPRQPQAQLLNENQQIGLTLILSLRMSLSYFTLQELANQLMLVALGDAERMLIQHIRRRVSGEGRWGVGKELEYVERLVSGLHMGFIKHSMLTHRIDSLPPTGPSPGIPLC